MTNEDIMERLRRISEQSAFNRAALAPLLRDVTIAEQVVPVRHMRNDNITEQTDLVARLLRGRMYPDVVAVEDEIVRRARGTFSDGSIMPSAVMRDFIEVQKMPETPCIFFLKPDE